MSMRSNSLTTILAVAALASVVASSCELLGDTTLPDYGKLTEISYGQHVQVLFDDRCTSCHDGMGQELSLKSWAAMQEGTSSGGVVIPFEPDRSRLVRMLTTRVGGVHPTELGEDTLSVDEVEFLRRWIELGARNDAGEVPYSNADNRALVAIPDEAVVAVVDVNRQAVARIIDLAELGFRSDSRPTSLSYAPDASGWFVSLPGEGVVLRFDADDVLSGIAEIESPGELSASADGRWLVVGRAAGDPSGRVDVVRVQDMRVHSVESVFPESAAAAARPQADFGFSASQSADQIIVFPLEAGGPTYVAMSGPRHGVNRLISTRDGNRLLAIGARSGLVVILDVTSPASGTQSGIIALGSSIRSAALLDNMLLAVNGDGNLLAVDPVVGASPRLVAQVDGATGVAGVAGRILVIGTVPAPAQQFRDVPVTGSIRVIDEATGAELRAIETEGRPVAIVVE
jgi:hypothetical protein